VCICSDYLHSGQGLRSEWVEFAGFDAHPSSSWWRGAGGEGGADGSGRGDRLRLSGSLQQYGGRHPIVITASSGPCEFTASSSSSIDEADAIMSSLRDNDVAMNKWWCYYSLFHMTVLLFVCLYVCIICVCVSMFVWYVCMVCIYTHTCCNLYLYDMHTYLYVWYTCLDVCTHTCVLSYVYVCRCVCMRACVSLWTTVISNRKLKISTAPTKAKSREPAYSQALIQSNRHGGQNPESQAGRQADKLNVVTASIPCHLLLIGNWVFFLCLTFWKPCCFWWSLERQSVAFQSVVSEWEWYCWHPAASIWFEIWGVVDSGKKKSIFPIRFSKNFDFSKQISK